MAQLQRTKPVAVRRLRGQPGRQLVAVLCCAVMPLLADAAAWVPALRDTDTVSAVWAYINHKDCAGAVRELNAGVAKDYPGVLLLAGAMYEGGICLKPSWAKAADYYLRADTAGHPRAAARLASGYADPAAGPDRAAALWWAIRSKSALPAACATVAAWVADADRFVAALSAWPKAQLEACVYVAGVLNTISGDLEFSGRAAAYGMQGTVILNYVPAEGRVDIDNEDIEFIQLGGWVDGDALRDRKSRDFKREFERDIRAASDRALRRYVKPDGIDASWRVQVRTVFKYVVCTACR